VKPFPLQGLQFLLVEERADGRMLFDAYHLSDTLPIKVVLWRSKGEAKRHDQRPSGRGWICGCGLDHRLTTLECLTCGESLNEFQIHMREGWMRAIRGRAPVPP
jgi:hypothetical protein